MKKRDHPASLSTGQRPRFRQCLTPAPAGNQVTINGHSVEVVESFPYLGSLIYCTGDSAPETKRRISITGDCMMALVLWITTFGTPASPSVPNCTSCILPIFLYGAETWAVTATAAKTFDVVDQWCLRRILNIHWTERITNNEVHSRTQQPLLSDAVHSRHLRLFGHICRADPVRIILRHCTPVLPVCPSTEGEDPAGRDRPGYELSRMITQSGSGDSSTACA